MNVGSGLSWMSTDDSVGNNDGSRQQQPMYSALPKAPAQVSAVEDLFEFICSGPLVTKLGLTSDKVAESIDEWLEYGVRLCKLFQLNDLYLTASERTRIYHYYIPVFLWCQHQISQHRAAFKHGDDIPPLVVC